MAEQPLQDSTAHPGLGRGLEKVSQTNAALNELVIFLWLTVVHTSRSKKFYKRRHPFQICCWNVRTLIDNNKRTERRTAILAAELQRYSIDIAALSETRFAGEDQLIEAVADIFNVI